MFLEYITECEVKCNKPLFLSTMTKKNLMTIYSKKLCLYRPCNSNNALQINITIKQTLINNNMKKEL